MSMIKIKDVARKFGNVLAVSDFSLEIEKGETVGILGPSGCGKTTLLRLIAGLETPDAGKIEINGKLTNNPKIIVPSQKRQIGMVFQDLALWPHLTVREHLKFVLDAQDIAKKFQMTNNKIEKLLNLVKLPDRYLSSYPHQLSGGEKQRLAIARSIAQEPQILLLDEPLANLDTMLKKNLQEEIKKLQKNLGLTLIYVTHEVREIKNLVERLIIMKQGKIVQEGDTKGVFASPKDEFVSRLIGKEKIE